MFPCPPASWSVWQSAPNPALPVPRHFRQRQRRNCPGLHHRKQAGPYSSDRLESIRLVYEEDIDEVFRAAIESVDEAIISSMLHAKAVTGRAGNHYKSLADLYMPEKKSEK